MKHLLKKLALLAIPLVLYLAFFAAFEPNNYFGLRAGAASTAPIARVRAFEENPGDYLLLGDSRLAHFDMDLAAEVSGKPWQNLAFGGASLRETLDLAEYALQQNPEVKELVLGLSFYTLNQSYDTDRMSDLQATLRNPAAYVLNLEYNVNTLTSFVNWTIWARQRLAGTTDDTWAQAQVERETGDWEYPADYTAPDGSLYPVHAKLAQYPATIYPVCQGWQLNQEQFDRLLEFAARCEEKGVEVTVVFPPMADNVLEEVCKPLGIADAMENEVLPRLFAAAEEGGFAVLDYEWTDRPEFEDDRQFFDGFHLDTSYGLPEFTRQLFGRLA